MIEVRKSNVDGRGVFATNLIPVGTQFKFNVILVNSDIKDETIYKYSFPASSKKEYSIVMGEFNFLNHNKYYNVIIKKFDKLNLIKTFEIIRDVKEGEELFLYYGDNYQKTLDLIK